MRVSHIAVFTVLSLLLVPGLALAESKTPEGTCEGAGPQTPRDIHMTAGTNPTVFAKAPARADMQLCDIHFHRFAEHKAEGYSKLMGEGDYRGYVCDGSTPAKDSDRNTDTSKGCAGIGVGVLVRAFAAGDQHEDGGEGKETAQLHGTLPEKTSRQDV